MKRLLGIAVAALLLSCFLAAPGSAHSTKGREKVALAKEEITVDDLAYFIESYVHRHKYRDLAEPTANRFYVKDFKGLVREGARATVAFEVLDTNGNKTFADSMAFMRGHDGIWYYRAEPDGKRQEVYTFVPRAGLFQKLWVPLCGGGAVLGIGGLAALRLRRKRREAEG